MTATDMPLAEKRLVLCNQMQLQRQRIALRLAPVKRAEFPRSMTMRLVIQRPMMLAQLALGLLRLWHWRRQTRGPVPGRESHEARAIRTSATGQVRQRTDAGSSSPSPS